MLVVVRSLDLPEDRAAGNGVHNRAPGELCGAGGIAGSADQQITNAIAVDIAGVRHHGAELFALLLALDHVEDRSGRRGVDEHGAGISSEESVIEPRADRQVGQAVAVLVIDSADRNSEVVLDRGADELIDQRAVHAGANLHDAEPRTRDRVLR